MGKNPLVAKAKERWKEFTDWWHDREVIRERTVPELAKDDKKRIEEVRKRLDKGASEEDITKEMKKLGYIDYHINFVFRKALGRNPPPPPKPVLAARKKRKDQKKKVIKVAAGIVSLIILVLVYLQVSPLFAPAPGAKKPSECLKAENPDTCLISLAIESESCTPCQLVSDPDSKLECIIACGGVPDGTTLEEPAELNETALNETQLGQNETQLNQTGVVE